MALTTSNIRVKPMRVTFGESRAQVCQVQTVADVAASLNNKYFWLYDEDATTKYYVWFNVGGTGVDPAPSGGTGAVVAISSGASANTVASAVQAAVDALADFVATVSLNVVTITNATAGDSRAPHDFNSGFTIKTTLYGSSAVEVGYIDAEMTLTGEQTLVDVTAHQTGASILGHIITGESAELEMTIKETSKAQLMRMFKQAGRSATSGRNASPTEVFGIGMEQLFSATIDKAQKLVLHPMEKVSGDLSEDVGIWKAYPQIGDLAMSGEDLFMMPVTFKIYPDLSKVEAARYWVYGDHTQTFTAP